MSKLKINKFSCPNGDFRYYIAASIRNGNKTSTKNLVKLGRRSEIIKEHPDVEAYLKQRLEEESKKNIYDSSIKLTFSFNKCISSDEVKSYFVGDIFLSRIYNDIKMKSLLEEIEKKHKFKYSLNDLLLFLLSQRLVDPCSKRKMYLNALEKRFLATNMSLQNVYRGLDILLEHKQEIIKHLYSNVPNKIKRNYSVLYFDGTNTYMETDVEEGLKARGKGKRNEKEPLVSFGLILDGSGLPITYTVFKGSGHESKQLIPLEETIVKDFNNSNFVMITDSALSSRENRCFNSINKRNYITVVPVRKMSDIKLNNYIFDEKKKWNSNNPNYNTPKKLMDAYKECILEKSNLEDENEKQRVDKKISDLLKVFLTRRYPVKLDEKPKNYRKYSNDKYIEEDYLISYSLSYALRDIKQRNRLIERAKKMIEKDGVKKNYKLGDPRQYIKEQISTTTGELANNYQYTLNKEIITNQEKLDGYYAVATSLTKENDELVIHWMKRRWMIEDTFLIMKQFLGFRPINHSKDTRIDAHFLTVFLTTYFYRYIQKLCHEADYESLKDISDENLFDLLRDFKVSQMQGYYFPSFNNDRAHKELQSLLNVEIDKEIMKASYIKKQYMK